MSWLTDCGGLHPDSLSRVIAERSMAMNSSLKKAMHLISPLAGLPSPRWVRGRALLLRVGPSDGTCHTH